MLLEPESPDPDVEESELEVFDEESDSDELLPLLADDRAAEPVRESLL